MCAIHVFVRDKPDDGHALLHKGAAICLLLRCDSNVRLFLNIHAHVSERNILLLRLIPISIVGATRFYDTFVDIISGLHTKLQNDLSLRHLLPGIIGYWSASFAAIVMADHTIVRRGRWSSYNISDWNSPRRLPLGVAAVLAFLGSIAIIVPCMSQVWYEGPIARAGTGDISMYTGFILGALLYVPLRYVEIEWEKQVHRGPNALI